MTLAIEEGLLKLEKFMLPILISIDYQRFKSYGNTFSFVFFFFYCQKKRKYIIKMLKISNY